MAKEKTCGDTPSVYLGQHIASRERLRPLKCKRLSNVYGACTKTSLQKQEEITERSGLETRAQEAFDIWANPDRDAPGKVLREGERINERLRAIIDCLVSAGHEAGDRSGDQDASLASHAHVAADFLNEVNGAGDVRVDDVAGGVEVLIEKGLPKRCPALASSAATGRLATFASN